MTQSDLQGFLDQKVEEFNTSSFIENDPIIVPKSFDDPRDIEITAFITCILAWGQRKTIISKSSELFERMDNAPHTFVVHHQPKDRKPLESFKHRTFQATDLLYFLEFLQWYYRNNDSFEDIFLAEQPSVRQGLINFHNLFFSLPFAPDRTKKHIATPEKRSTCKRLNMFLRWMVRDDGIVDFGLWKRVNKSTLYMPLDVHVERVARHLGLLKRKQRDWEAVEELTANLREFDPDDPVKYDYALFGLGASGLI